MQGRLSNLGQGPLIAKCNRHQFLQSILCNVDHHWCWPQSVKISSCILPSDLWWKWSEQIKGFFLWEPLFKTNKLRIDRQEIKLTKVGNLLFRLFVRRKEHQTPLSKHANLGVRLFRYRISTVHKSQKAAPGICYPSSSAPMKAFYFHGKLKKNVQQNLLTGPQLALDKLHNLHSVLYQRHMSNRPTPL